MSWNRICMMAWLGCCMSLWPGLVCSQSPPPLREQVARYLAEVDDRQAAKRLREILALRPDAASLTSVLKAKAPPFPSRRFHYRIPFQGRMLDAEILVPANHTPKSDPLPVCVNLLLGRIPDTVEVKGAINVWVRNFKPERRTEECRDGFLKVAHAVAWRANGDPRNLWLTGFSWAGHAVWDIALHRPQILRGFIPMAGAPRRSAFRLLANLKGQAVFAFCGSKDDRELIWNLKELRSRSKKHGFHYEFGTDPRVEGRFIPAPRFVPKIGGFIAARPPRSTPGKGRLLADAKGVHNGWIRIDSVDAKRTKLPKRIPVSAKLTRDEQRRKTIAAMLDRRVQIEWTWRDHQGSRELLLNADAVKSITLYLRESMALEGKKLAVSGGRPRVRARTFSPDPRVMLEEARRSGRRDDLVWDTLRIRF